MQGNISRDPRFSTEDENKLSVQYGYGCDNRPNLASSVINQESMWKWVKMKAHGAETTMKDKHKFNWWM